MMVGFFSIMLKGQSIHFFIYCILCPKDGANFSFAAFTNSPLQCVQQSCTHCQGHSLGVMPSLLATVSHQISFRPWAAASANVIIPAMLCASFLNNHKQQVKTLLNSLFIFSFSLTSLPPILWVKPYSVVDEWIYLILIAATKAAEPTILSWSKFRYFPK